MNRKLLNGLLVIAVATGGAVTFTSCKDEDFRNDVLLTQLSIEDQLDAIRDLTDEEFLNNLQQWLDEQTVNKLWEYVKEGPNGENYSVIEPYIQGLYDILFNNIFPGEQWFQDVQQIANLAMRPSSVEVSHMYNTAIGSVTTPLGINTNILATYKFKANNQVNFPAVDNINTVYGLADAQTINNVKALSPKDAFSAASGTVYYADPVEFGDMGGAIVTINPANADVANYTVEFVNSKGVSFLSTKGGGLEALKPYTGDELTFGATRAASPGVYQLDANASKAADPDMMLVDFDKEGVKNAFESFLANKDLADIASLGRAMINAVNNKVPALALQLSWTENEPVMQNGALVMENGAVKTTPVINYWQSGFDYAAVVAHPLSYSVGKTLADKIQNRWPDGILPTFDSPLADIIRDLGGEFTISFEPVGDVKYVTVELKYTGESGTIIADVKDPQGNVIGSIELEYSASGIADPEQDSLDYFLAQLLESLGKDTQEQINDVIDGINDVIANINDQLEKMQADLNKAVDNIAGSEHVKAAQRIIDYYNRFANRFNNMLSDPEKYFGVLALYETAGGGVGRMSTLYNDGVVANGSFDMYLTSYNAEFIVPSFKKYVAITAINGQAAKAADNTGNLNTVLPGYTNKVTVNLPANAKSGDILTITYMSLDYRGNTSMQNYYVRVK
ncbi:MAG: hypothetical protein J1F43_04630 [Muribaculaceae bacterium]|nr:hypothetical protein [Muribaculaceae bacterium]